MEYAFVPMSVDDRKAVIDIFNYYVENSFAAYLETKVPYMFFDSLMEMSEGYPRVTARDESGRIVEFGMLRVHNLTPDGYVENLFKGPRLAIERDLRF
jgi:phosphinothricin acetyltransferase